MSIVATYARLSQCALEAVRCDSEWIENLCSGRVPSAQVLDLDKACDGIVWLLSRMPPPPAPPVAGSGFVLSRSLAPLLSGAGGTKEPQLEAPYGSASLLDPQQVAELNDWLRGVQADQLRMRYDSRAMAQAHIYPQIWVEDGPAAFEEYLLPYFDRLCKFIAEAAAAKQCVLVFFA